MKNTSIQKVVLTFDVEGGHESSSVDTLIWGKIGLSDNWGITKQIAMLDQYGIKGLFFVDFAEAWTFGEKKIAEIVQYISLKGHDVGVHLHPQYMSDSQRLFLYEYSYDEQFDLIKRCTELYKKILNKAPLAFRAGKYGANMDTLRILGKLGYRYDFSEFVGQKWCGIVPPICNVVPRQIDGLIEFPVTVFKSFSLGRIYSRYDKLEVDIDSVEMKSVLRGYQKKNNNVIIILFAHSFSFLNFRGREDNPKLRRSSVKKFEKILSFISKSNEFDCLSLYNLDSLSIDDEMDNETDIYKTHFLYSLFFSIKRVFSIVGYNKKAQLLLVSSLIIFLLICTYLSLLLGGIL